MPRSTSPTVTSGGVRAMNMHEARGYSNTMNNTSIKRPGNLRLKKYEARSSSALATHHHFSNAFSKFESTDGVPKPGGAKSGKKLIATEAGFFRSFRHNNPLNPPTMSLEEVMKCNEDAMEALRQNELTRSNELISQALRASEEAVCWFQRDAARRDRRQRSRKKSPAAVDPPPSRIHCEGWLLLHAVSLNNMGCQRRREGKIEEALACLERARVVELQVCGRPSCSTMMNLSTLLLSMGDVGGAFPIAQECVIAAQEGDRVLFITALHNLAITLGRHEAARQRSAALPTMLRALREAQDHFGPDHPTTALLKRLCDASHGWIRSESPKKADERLPPVPARAASREPRTATGSRVRPATSQAAPPFPASAKSLCALDRGGGGAVPALRQKPPPHLLPLHPPARKTYTALELQTRAQQALATLHFGTPTASPKYGKVEEVSEDKAKAEGEGEREEEAEAEEEGEAEDLPQAASGPAPEGGVASISELAEPLAAGDGAGDPLPTVFVEPPFPDFAMALGATAKVGAGGRPWSPSLSHPTDSAASSEPDDPPHREDPPTTAKNPPTGDWPFSAENPRDGLATTLAGEAALPGYYIHLSPSAQPKFLRFVAGRERGRGVSLPPEAPFARPQPCPLPPSPSEPAPPPAPRGRVFPGRGAPAASETTLAEELDEEERFRQERARAAREAAKEAERQAVWQRLQSRLRDRAARRLQAGWRRWWKAVGWARREARRARSWRERNSAAAGVEPVAVGPSACAYYGPLTVAATCGVRWLGRTPCLRYLARHHLPHRGRREAALHALVVKLQAVWRGFSARGRAREAAETRRVALTDVDGRQRRRERREYAAIVVQKFARTVLAKKAHAARYRERYDPPARRIQGWFRSRLASLRARGLDRRTVGRVETAACAIQRAWRRYQLRIRYYMYCLRLRIGALRDAENRATLARRAGAEPEAPLRLLEGPAAGSDEGPSGASEDGKGVRAEPSKSPNASPSRVPDLVVPRTDYELDCLARAPFITRVLDAEHERFHVRIFGEPAAARQRQGWIDAIQNESLEIHQRRDALAFLRQQREEEAIDAFARRGAAVRIQRAFRGWLRMRDDPHRDRTLLFHSRRRYQRREGEWREARVAAAAARLRAIKRYGDVAAPMRESHHRVREELERTMQDETGFISDRSL